jgi:Carboxypeptidase regulatory-like domain
MRFSILSILPALLLAQPPQQAADKASLEGHVFNSASSEPLRKVYVTMKVQVAQTQAMRPQQQQQQQPAPSGAITVSTDATGKFEFPSLEPGSYTLSARRDGFANASYHHPGKSQAEPIVLVAGDRKTGIELRLVPYGAIAGRIADEDGDPIQGIQVSAMVYQYTNKGRELVSHSMSQTTDDFGNYRIYNLAPGRYYLKAGPPGMRLSPNPDEAESFMPAFYPGAADASGATPLNVTPGQQLQGLNLALRKARLATIRGRVIAPAGAENLVVGLMVVSGQGSSSTMRSVQDKDGKFELFGIAPGPVFLTGGYTLNRERNEMRLPLTVGSSDINGVELRPMSPMEIAGRMQIEGDTKVQLPQIRVALAGAAGGYSFVGDATVKEDGSFTFHNVAPGTYSVSCNGIRDLYLKSVRWGEADITDGELDVTNGLPPNAQLSIALSAAGGEITGVVNNDKDTPADSATVTLVPVGRHQSRPFYKQASTNDAGHFDIRGVAPGSYKLFAWDKVDFNAVVYDPDFLRPYDGTGVGVEVHENDKKTQDLKLIVTPQDQ